MSAAPTVKCPTCGTAVTWTPEALWRPFCSERCKERDLGAWATGQYTIAVSQESSDEPADDTVVNTPRH